MVQDDSIKFVSFKYRNHYWCLYLEPNKVKNPDTQMDARIPVTQLFRAYLNSLDLSTKST